MKRFGFASVLAAGLAAAILGYGLGSAGIASGLLDPVDGVGALDESVYGAAAIDMAQGGDWLTPHYDDRLLLNKPPVVYWVGALGWLLAGSSVLALRLAPFLASLLTACLVFAWGRRPAGFAAGLCALLLLVGNPTFHIFSRRLTTDALLVAWTTAAFFVLGRDPQLQQTKTVLWAGVLSGLAVLTKSVAGVMPLAALSLYFLVSPTAERPPLRRVAGAVSVAALVALPWHVYQLMIHPDWFLAEYFQEQIVKTGSNVPWSEALSAQASFYFSRFLQLDPVLLAASIVGVALAALHAVRSRLEPDLRVLFCWLVVCGGALVGFRYQSFSYALPLLPALALLATRENPLFHRFRGVAAAALVMMLIVARGSIAEGPRKLDYSSGSTIAAAPAIQQYCRMNRDAELAVIDVPDEFLATALGLPFVRYGIPAAGVDPAKLPAFLLDLGVVAPMRSFDESFVAGHAQRLRAWGVADSRPIGTMLLYNSQADIDDFVRRSPGRDFLMPAGRAQQLGPTRRQFQAVGDYVLLLAPAASRRSQPYSPLCED